MLACVILLANLLSVAQGGYGRPMQPARERGKLKLSGVVVNSVTGEPIARALVQVFVGRQRSALTGSDGRFELDGLDAGRTMLVAQKPGFFSDRQAGHVSTQPKIVDIRSDTGDVVVRLVPESIIHGQVRDADDEPVEHALVRVNRSRVFEGRRYWTPLGQANASSAGEFRVASLPPGRYYISVAASPRSGLSVPASEGYGSIYYPAVPEASATNALELSAGQKLPLDFSLPPEPTFKISGNVSVPPSGQVSYMQIVDRFGEPLPFPTQMERQSGKFEIASVPAGTYTLLANGNDEAQHPLRAELGLGVAGAVSGLHLFLAPAPSLEVKVETHFVQPPSLETDDPAIPRGSMGGHLAVEFQGGLAGGNARRTGSAESPMVSVRLRSTGPLQHDAWSVWESPPGHQSVSVINIASGRYAVDVQSQSYQAYVQSAVSGGINLFSEELVVAPGGKLPPVEVVLRDDGGTIHGTVSASGLPFSGTVIAVPAFAPLQYPRMTPIGADGAFAFSNLAPGDYQVFAFDQVERVEYANPEVLRGYSAKAVSVSISPAGKSVVALQGIFVDEP